MWSIDVRRIPYVYAFLIVDCNDYVHVRFMSNDVSTMANVIMKMRDKDPDIVTLKKVDEICARDPCEDRDVYVAMHKDKGVDEVKCSFVIKRTLDELQKERLAWLEPLGDEPDLLSVAALSI